MFCNSRYDNTCRYCCEDRLAGTLSGIVVSINLNNPCAVLYLSSVWDCPIRAGPVIPCPLVPWHAAQLLANTVLPESASYAAVKFPGVVAEDVVGVVLTVVEAIGVVIVLEEQAATNNKLPLINNVKTFMPRVFLFLLVIMASP